MDALGRADLGGGDEIRIGTQRLILQAPGLRPERVLTDEAARPRRSPWPWLLAAGAAAAAGAGWYLGWFDGNATSLDPLPAPERAQKLVALAGGEAAENAAALERLLAQQQRQAGAQRGARPSQARRVNLHVETKALEMRGRHQAYVANLARALAADPDLQFHDLHAVDLGEGDA